MFLLPSSFHAHKHFSHRSNYSSLENINPLSIVYAAPPYGGLVLRSLGRLKAPTLTMHTFLPPCNAALSGGKNSRKQPERYAKQMNIQIIYVFLKMELV
jgi:hypothetical protein